MKKYLLFLFALPMMAANCNKEDNPTATQESFLPTGTNSTWTYDTKNYITSATASYSLTVTGKDTTINAKTFKVLSRSGGENEYLNRTGNDYYQFANFVATNQKIELLYLKDNVAVGLSWDQNITITVPGAGTFTAKLTSKIEEKGISYTVMGKTYNDVIRVKSTIGAITIPGLPTAIVPVTDINFYYARGVGRIYNRAKISITIPTVAPINTDDESSLKTYTIVP